MTPGLVVIQLASWWHSSLVQVDPGMAACLTMWQMECTMMPWPSCGASLAPELSLLARLTDQEHVCAVVAAARSKRSVWMCETREAGDAAWGFQHRSYSSYRLQTRAHVALDAKSCSFTHTALPVPIPLSNSAALTPMVTVS